MAVSQTKVKVRTNSFTHLPQFAVDAQGQPLWKELTEPALGRHLLSRDHVSQGISNHLFLSNDYSVLTRLLQVGTLLLQESPFAATLTAGELNLSHTMGCWVTLAFAEHRRTHCSMCFRTGVKLLRCSKVRRLGEQRTTADARQKPNTKCTL